MAENQVSSRSHALERGFEKGHCDQRCPMLLGDEGGVLVGQG